MRTSSIARAVPLLVALAAACHAPRHDARVDATELALDVPATWSRDADPAEPASDRWWVGFGDPRLAGVVEEALANNRDLAAAAARVEQSAALARIAGADRQPSVSASLGGQRARQVFVGLPVPGSTGPLTSTATAWSTSLDVSWEADLWGRLAARQGAALADLEAGRADERAARHSIAARTAKAWFGWQSARAQARLASETEANFRRTSELLRDRYELGLVPLLDVHLADSNLATAEALREQREEAVQLAARQIDVLLGRYPSGELEDEAGGDESLADELLPLPAPPPAGLPSDLLARRPDLVAAELRTVAADERLREARGNLLPSLRLTASGGRTSDELSDLFDSDFDVWSLFAGLTAPLFQGGRLRAGVDVESARVQEALARYANAVLTAFLEVESALVSEEALGRREERLRVAASEAVAARELAQDRYRSGLTDFLVVLDAQRRALDAESALIDVRRQRLTTRVDLHLALGGGFGSTEVAPEPDPERPEGSR